MRRTEIRTDDAPAPSGGYSQGVVAGGLLFCAGQGPYASDGALVRGTVAEQTRQVLTNLDAVARAAGASLSDAVRVGVYLSTLDHFEDAAQIEVALGELHRVLRPGGHLVLTLDNPANPLIRLRNALPEAWARRTGLSPFAVGATLGRRAGTAALVRADLGIAMGSGTDAAIEASDLTLVRSDLRSTADGIRLARATFRTIRVNLFWAFAYNIAALPLAGVLAWAAGAPSVPRGRAGAVLTTARQWCLLVLCATVPAAYLVPGATSVSAVNVGYAVVALAVPLVASVADALGASLPERMPRWAVAVGLGLAAAFAAVCVAIAPATPTWTSAEPPRVRRS